MKVMKLSQLQRKPKTKVVISPQPGCNHRIILTGIVIFFIFILVVIKILRPSQETFGLRDVF
jgi:hypothetical protein